MSPDPFINLQNSRTKDHPPFEARCYNSKGIFSPGAQRFQAAIVMAKPYWETLEKRGEAKGSMEEDDNKDSIETAMSSVDIDDSDDDIEEVVPVKTKGKGKEREMPPPPQPNVALHNFSIFTKGVRSNVFSLIDEETH